MNSTEERTDRTNPSVSSSLRFPPFVLVVFLPFFFSSSSSSHPSPRAKAPGFLATASPRFRLTPTVLLPYHHQVAVASNFQIIPSTPAAREDRKGFLFLSLSLPLSPRSVSQTGGGSKVFGTLVWGACLPTRICVETSRGGSAGIGWFGPGGAGKWGSLWIPRTRHGDPARVVVVVVVLVAVRCRRVARWW